MLLPRPTPPRTVPVVDQVSLRADCQETSMPNRRAFLQTGAAALAASALWRGAVRGDDAPRRSNVIFILGDDVGIADVSAYGGDIPTPHIDALAAGGTRFERCYSTPLCGPSRCLALTGRYPFRTGLISNNSHNAVSPQREVMWPTSLKQAGYVTASVGKWGQICLGPHEWGFQEYLTFPGSGHYWIDQGPRYTQDGQAKLLKRDEYMPDLLHEYATRFLRRHRSDPFFLYYPMSDIHGPIVRTPESKPGAGPAELYADNVAYMDELVGKLVAEVENLGLRDNTLILFSGDNGTAVFGPATIHGRQVHGRKGSMLEGGARVPLIANWPGVTPAGAVVDDLIDFSDYYATFAELTDAALPAGVTLDSRSFAPQIKGQPGAPRDWTYVELAGRSYVTDKQYKLMKNGGLFDMSQAPFEEIPVPDDTKDEAAIAGRRKLEAVAATHRALPVDDATRAAIRQEQQQQQRRRLQQQQQQNQAAKP
jgi:arylsulfatase A